MPMPVFCFSPTLSPSLVSRPRMQDGAGSEGKKEAGKEQGHGGGAGAAGSHFHAAWRRALWKNSPPLRLLPSFLCCETTFSGFGDHAFSQTFKTSSLAMLL